MKKTNLQTIWATLIVLAILSIVPVFGFDWNTGIISYWSFNESSLTNMTSDNTGNGSGGIAYGAFTRVPGKIGNGFNFTTANGNITFAKEQNFDSVFNGTSSFSVTYWIKLNCPGCTGGNTFRVLGKSNATDVINTGGANGFSLWRSGNVPLDFTLGTDGTNVMNERLLTDNTNYGWEFWTITYNGSIGGNGSNLNMWKKIKIYRNATNISIFGNLYQYDNSSILNDFPFTISGYSGNGGLNATIDEVGVWARELIPSEITELYNSGAGLQSPFGFDDTFFTNFVENSQTFNMNTTEGNFENYSINITYDSSYYNNIIANLIYNGTSYNPTLLTSGDNAVLSASLNVPFVTSQQNITFYWQIGLINSTGTFYSNSTTKTQTVNDLGNIGGCDAYSTVVLNYSLKDERTQALLNTTIWNDTIEVSVQVYPVSSNTLLMNMSKLYNGTSTAAVCFNATLLSSSQYRMYAQVKYYADGYVTRYNYIQNYTLTNASIPKNINLFDLQTTMATKFLITYKDATFLAVSGALVSINRQYLSEGVFKTVSVSQTDDLGQATGYFDLPNAVYSITVTKEGQTLSTFDNIAIFCTDTLAQNCQLNLDAGASTTDTINFYTYNNLNFLQSFNSTTRIYSLNFNTIDNTVSLISINLTKFDMYSNTTLCSKQVSTSSGALSCTVPASYGNITFSATIYKDGQIITSTVYTIITPASSAFSGNIVVFSLGIILSLGMLFLPSAIGVVLAGIVGIGFAIVFFAISGSIIGSGFFIMFVVIGGLIIWRIRSGGSE